jgi:hypothetical protein
MLAGGVEHVCLAQDQAWGPGGQKLPADQRGAELAVAVHEGGQRSRRCSGEGVGQGDINNSQLATRALPAGKSFN